MRRCTSSETTRLSTRSLPAEWLLSLLLLLLLLRLLLFRYGWRGESVGLSLHDRFCGVSVFVVFVFFSFPSAVVRGVPSFCPPVSPGIKRIGVALRCVAQCLLYFIFILCCLVPAVVRVWPARGVRVRPLQTDRKSLFRMDASMMMSQRPSGGGGGGGSSSSSRPAASSSSSGGGGGGGGSSTIGKYKGVMLCNRPSRGPAQAGNTANKTLASGRLQPFRAGGHNPIENDIGLTRARPERHAAPRKKVESVTAKHKKWLANYTAEKLRLEAEMEKSEEEKQKQREQFMKRERKLRNAILTNVKDKGGDGGESKRSNNNNKTNSKKSRQVDHDEPQTTTSRDADLDELLKFTEDINDEDFDAQMEAMLEDGDEDWAALLDEAENAGGGAVEFDPESDDNELVHPDTGASGYDGDDAISRAEWRERMVEMVDPETGEPSDSDDAVSRRRYLLDQGLDVQRLYAGDARKRAARRGPGAVGLTAEALKEWNASNGGGGRRQQDEEEELEDDIMSTASAVLADSKKIRSVHSARSVAAIARKKEMRVPKIDRLPEIHEAGGIPAPKIVTLDEGRLEYKKHANQLPYMNRNPAV